MGFLVVVSGADAQQLVPRWQGTKAAAGEMWKRESLTDGWEDTVLVASDSAVVTIAAEKGSGESRQLRNDKMAQFASSLTRVRWDR